MVQASTIPIPISLPSYSIISLVRTRRVPYTKPSLSLLSPRPFIWFFSYSPTIARAKTSKTHDMRDDFYRFPKTRY